MLIGPLRAIKAIPLRMHYSAYFILRGCVNLTYVPVATGVRSRRGFARNSERRTCHLSKSKPYIKSLAAD